MFTRVFEKTRPVLVAVVALFLIATAVFAGNIVLGPSGPNASTPALGSDSNSTNEPAETAEPTETALHMRAFTNSSHRLCSSRAMSQNET